MPVPSSSVSSAPSRSNGVNSSPSRSAAMPCPVSETLIWTRASDGRWHRDGDRAAGPVVLDRVGHVEQDLLGPLPVSEDVAVALLGPVHDELDAALLGERSHQVGRLLDQVAGQHRLG